MDVFAEERKYFLNTISRQNFAVTITATVDDLVWLSRDQDDVRLDLSMVGSTVIFLYRLAGLRCVSECKVLSVGVQVRSLAGETQTLVELQRTDSTRCVLGLTDFKLWSPHNDHFDFLWLVRDE